MILTHGHFTFQFPSNEVVLTASSDMTVRVFSALASPFPASSPQFCDARPNLTFSPPTNCRTARPRALSKATPNASPRRTFSLLRLPKVLTKVAWSSPLRSTGLSDSGTSRPQPTSGRGRCRSQSARWSCSGVRTQARKGRKRAMSCEENRPSQRTRTGPSRSSIFLTPQSPPRPASERRESCSAPRARHRSTRSRLLRPAGSSPAVGTASSRSSACPDSMEEPRRRRRRHRSRPGHAPKAARQSSMSSCRNGSGPALHLQPHPQSTPTAKWQALPPSPRPSPSSSPHQTDSPTAPSSTSRRVPSPPIRTRRARFASSKSLSDRIANLRVVSGRTSKAEFGSRREGRTGG